MKLHAVNHDLPTVCWCGVAVLSAITGRPTSECMTTLKRACRSRRSVQGVTVAQLQRAAEGLGVRLTKLKLRPLWLIEVLDMTDWKSFPAMVVCETDRHLFTLHRRYFCDNWQRTPGAVPMRMAPIKIIGVYRVTKI